MSFNQFYITEAFRAKDLEKATASIISYLQKNLGEKVYPMVGVDEFRNKYGEQIGKLYFVGDTGKGVRFNWKSGKGSKEIASIDIWDDSDSKKPVIMLASGFAEGVDLKGEEFGFQVITKVMYPSMADKLNAMLYKEDPQRMAWQTVRTILQQSGRICRGPEDKGDTWIIDGAFGNKKKKRMGLYQRSNSYFPQYFKSSLEWK